MFDLLLCLVLGLEQQAFGHALNQPVEHTHIVNVHHEQVYNFAVSAIIPSHFVKTLLSFQQVVQ